MEDNRLEVQEIADKNRRHDFGIFLSRAANFGLAFSRRLLYVADSKAKIFFGGRVAPPQGISSFENHESCDNGKM